MGKVVESISTELREFIEEQHVFFVATAPLSGEGHVNLSPKGLDTFRVLSEHEVAYLDLTGSGNETAAHLLENGRITFMFCAFSGRPRILRLYGRGRIVNPAHPDWPRLESAFPSITGTRQFILASVDRVQLSCGFAVPLMEYKGERDDLIRWAVKKGDALQDYRAEKNASSIDGLPAPSV